MANSIELKKECLKECFTATSLQLNNLIELILYKLHANRAKKKEEQEKNLEKKIDCKVCMIS